MSDAVPGDGKLRGQIAEAGAAAKASVEDAARKAGEYHALITQDEVKTRNNSSTEAASTEVGNIEVMSGKLKESLQKIGQADPIMKHAHEHHKSQPSVLPNNGLGQRRRKVADQSTKIVDPLDWGKVAAAAAADNLDTKNPNDVGDWFKKKMTSP